MNSKKLTFGISATVALGVLASAVPSYAMSLDAGSTLNLGSTPNGGVSFDSSTGDLDFFANSTGGGQRVVVANSSLSFSGASSGPTPPSRIADLFLNDDGGGIFSFVGSLPNFITGVDLFGSADSEDDVSFELTEFVFDSNSSRTTSLKGNFFIDGVFANPGSGRFTSQLDIDDPSSYSISIKAQAVPTPALLPGLLGFGATILRKRKQAAAIA